MNCLITGATQGIGANLAYKMANLGYNLCLTYCTNQKKLEKIKKDIENKYQVKCLILKCDLKNEAEIKEVINLITKEYKTLDVLINNAATYHDNEIKDKTKEEFMEVLEVNVVGTFLVTKYASYIMNKDSIVINMASTDGISTYNKYNLDYAVSKAGIIHMTKCLSLILNNRVVAIAPNWVATPGTLSLPKEFLDNELKRINQNRLIPIATVVNKIVEVIETKEIKSGEVIEIYE